MSKAGTNWCAKAAPPLTTPNSWPASKRHVLRLGDQQLRACGGVGCAGRSGAAAGSAMSIQRVVEPDEAKFTGVVFKGRPTWTRRTATASPSCGWPAASSSAACPEGGAQQQEMRPNTVVNLLSQRRELVDEGVGRRHHRHPEPRRAAARRHADRGRGAAVHGLPFFAPEMFRTVEVQGFAALLAAAPDLQQLGEGAIRSSTGLRRLALMLGAIGPTAVRGSAAPAEERSTASIRAWTCRASPSRWIATDDEAKLKKFIDSRPLRRLRRGPARRPSWLTVARTCAWRRAHARHPSSTRCASTRAACSGAAPTL